MIGPRNATANIRATLVVGKRGDLSKLPSALEQPRGGTARARRHLAAALPAAPETTEILNKAIGEALKDPKPVAQLAEVGGIPKPMPAEFGKLVADETEKWRKVVEFAGVSVDSAAFSHEGDAGLDGETTSGRQKPRGIAGSPATL